jgi:hypothetical protein
MGTVKIEGQEIASLQSDYFYELQLTDGSRHFGSIATSDQAGQIQVTELDNELPLDWQEVVRIRPIEKSFLDRLDVYFSAGYSYTRASSVSQTSVNTTISYESEKSRNSLDGRTNISESDDETSSSTKVDLDRAVWTDRKGVFRSLFGNYESSDELGLDHRVGVGAGLGRNLIDTYKSRLTGVAGLQVITEQTKDDGADQNIELYLSSRYLAWRFNTPELDMDFGLILYPSLTERGRIRSSSDLRIRWEIIEDLFFDITAYGSYDNKADTSSGIDYGVTTGVGWEL